MRTLQLSNKSRAWLCSDNSGIAIYNGYAGNTVFIRSDLENTSDQISTSLQEGFSSSRLSALLGVSDLESSRMLNQLIDWGILIGSDD